MTNPDFVRPMLAKLVKLLPEGPDREYDLNLDWYRMETRPHEKCPFANLPTAAEPDSR
jgi:hypothetical protein